MRYAVYRVLYGEDFIKQSIKSIEPYFDKIFVFWDDTPWGNISEVLYNDAVIKIPKPPDASVERVKELKSDKVILIYDHVENNLNQFSHLVNDHILGKYPKPDQIMFIEPDHVWNHQQLSGALEESRAHLACSSRQVELWKTLEWRIPERPGRLSCVFWNLQNLDRIPQTGRHANIPNIPFLNSYVYNLGFCVSDKTMFMKHVLAIGFSQKIGDSLPNYGWLDNKWRSWNPVTNNSNLEISLGYEHLIPHALKFEEDLKWLQSM